ncbi:MAG: hypothetical protein SPI36_05115 [Candidatus Onthovivens sp.]|nr:hypothetical protein [Candidatus Onthovivens sp.]
MKFILLGINGSIGKTTLKVFETIKNKWEIVGFSIGDDAKNVDELINKYHPLAISFKNEKDYYLYKSLYPNIKFFFGFESYLKLLDLEYDCLINALSGFNGLEPTLKCLENNKTVLLANKESLVVGGELIKKTLKTSGKLIPIDSEHVAVLKCLENESKNNVDSIYITASGGPFFDYSDENLNKVSVNEALNHPTWKMGKRITIDSSTMVNKCFELIECYYLFNEYTSNYKVLVDRKSLIHGFVVFKDGRIKQCKYAPTMGNPIKYSLDLVFNNEVDLSDVYLIDKIDQSLLSVKQRYEEILDLSNKVIINKGSYGAVLNAIDEELVNYFLNNKIKFIDITEIIVKIMNTCVNKKCLNLKDLKECDINARKAVKYLIEGRINEN